jgi:hypothetical protein
MTLVKVGGTYVNLDQVAEVRDTGVDLEIFYRGSDRATVLRGVEANRLREWLDAKAVDLNPSG